MRAFASTVLRRLPDCFGTFKRVLPADLDRPGCRIFRMRAWGPRHSSAYLTNVEELGGGTIAYVEAKDGIRPHIHVSVGLKAHSANGHTSHLLSAKVQFLTEMLFVEISGWPRWRSQPSAAALRSNTERSRWLA